MAGNYHELYKEFDVMKGRGSKNGFHCFNKSSHNQGDRSASMSIDNNTGVYKCHGCGIEGNFQIFYKELLSMRTGVGFIEWAIIRYNLEHLLDEDFSHLNKEIEKLQAMIPTPRLKTPATLAPEIPEGDRQKYVDWLQRHTMNLHFLKNMRNASPELLKKLGVGLSDDDRIIFPICDPDGRIINYKIYNHRAVTKKDKWRLMHLDYNDTAFPFYNLEKPSMFIFEGHPDTVTAHSLGIDNAITFGSAGNTDVTIIFGEERCRKYFTNKEIAIVFDADDSGRKGSKALATSLSAYTKNIRVVDISILFNNLNKGE